MRKRKYAKRALRRAYLENVRRKAWKKSQELYAKWSAEWLSTAYSLKEIYIGRIVNEGHWIYGGCKRARCGLCQPRGLSHRDQCIREQFAQEYKEWLRGSL